MLIQKLDVQQGLIINKNVTVTILDIKGCQVRFGINAPKDIEVNREEIYLRKHPSMGNSPVVDIAAYFFDYSN